MKIRCIQVFLLLKTLMQVCALGVLIAVKGAYGILPKTKKWQKKQREKLYRCLTLTGDAAAEQLHLSCISMYTRDSPAKSESACPYNKEANECKCMQMHANIAAAPTASTTANTATASATPTQATAAARQICRRRRRRTVVRGVQPMLLVLLLLLGCHRLLCCFMRHELHVLHACMHA